MEDVKIYGLCLERLRHQIGRARDGGTAGRDGRVLLESYLSDDVDDVIDVLELYDIPDHTEAALREKLDDLAYTVSVLLREQLTFGRDDRGHYGLFAILAEAAGGAAGSARAVEVVLQ